jgi:hypothetical protein
MQRRPFETSWGGRFAVAIFAAGFVGCGADTGDLAPEPCPINTPGCIVRTDAGVPDSDAAAPAMADAATGDAAATRSAFCGLVGCFPGNPSACGVTPEGDAGSRAHELDTDATDEPPSDDAAADREPPSAVDASVGDAGHPDASIASADAADASLDVSADAQGDVGANDEPKVQRSCYVRPSDAVPGSRVTTECAPVGAGAAGSACDDSTDCGALLACVDVDGKPACRRFSCALPTSCPSGSYYRLEPLRVSGATMSDLQVPVCLPTDHCDIMATLPIPCPIGQICAVVGTEGDTTCVVPGTAKLGDPCDDLNLCAEGLVCSKLKNQCLKMCRTAAGATECPGGTCQGGNLSLPDGVGICVGTNPDGG